MRTRLTILCGALLGMMAQPGLADVIGGTGAVGFRLRNFGSIQFGAPAWNATRHLDRLSFVAALDSGSVFDYINDPDDLESPVLLFGGLADTVAMNLSDNSFSGLPPNIRVRNQIYAWTGDTYLLVHFTLWNDSSETVTIVPGGAMFPRPNGTYGGETVAYDATGQIAYFYRTGEDHYLGIKYLGGEPYSFHSMNWSEYTPDIGADAASDTTRYILTATPGFDGEFTADADGSVYHLNAPALTLAPGDSAVVPYALIYATSLAGLQSEATAAQSRYDGIFTSVSEGGTELPAEYWIGQNYPNPFNPQTRIEFALPVAGHTTVQVYDMLGREVASLVNELLAPGVYAADFSAASLASGVYLYQIRSGSFTSTRRMLLVR